jgi:YebC/PmpR family DNA-binding regulatory protein
MSGHSKWAQIKRKKAVTDQRRGKVISKHLRAIQAAARSGGSADPAANLQLRNAIELARNDDVPMDNIERALAKFGGDDGEAAQFEDVTYEGYAPGGVAVLVYALTNNRNRTASEVRHVFSARGGSLGASGAVAWQFERRGILEVPENSERSQEAAIDLGALDLIEHEDGLEIHVAPDSTYAAKEALSAQGIPVESASISMVPQNTVTMRESDSEPVERLIEALEDLDDIQDVYSNLEVTE